VETMIDHPEGDKELEDQDEASRGYHQRVQQAENWYEGLADRKQKDPSKLRKYIGKRLRAVYWLLHKRGVYRVTSEWDAEDFEVITPDASQQA